MSVKRNDDPPREKHSDPKDAGVGMGTCPVCGMLDAIGCDCPQGGSMNLLDKLEMLANAARGKRWESDEPQEFLLACSPERVLALIAVCRAARLSINSDAGCSCFERCECRAKADDAIRAALATLKEVQ